MAWNRIGRSAPVWILLAAAGTAGCGAETLITGLGNSSNVIGANTVDLVALELARQPAIPAVGDDDLRAVFGAIRARALEGDGEAALVLLRLAAHQRESAVERQ
jgi:hypothetical protein